MTDSSREARLTAAFVKLADTLTADYDMIDLLDTLVRECVDLLDTHAGGLMIADPAARQLQLVVSTSEEASFVEVNQLNAGDGPCIDCYISGKPVSVGDIEAESDRWPSFRESALAAGFKSMHAFPLKLRGTVVGAMNLFSTTTGNLTDQDIAAGQGLADVATIGILQERNVRDSTVLSEQLQRALDSRIVIEQAKGIIAQSANVSMNDAFTVLRDHARDNGLRLGDVATEVANRTLNFIASTVAKR